MEKRLCNILLAGLTVLTSWGQYFTTSELPDPFKFMPGPPDYIECQHSVDFKQYFFCKDVRLHDTARALVIKSDVTYGYAAWKTIISSIVGYDVDSVSPAFSTLITQGFNTAGLSNSKTKAHYSRVRPCVKFNESPYSSETLSEMKQSYSYPSAHSTTGWASGMLAAITFPSLQDTLLSRAYEYGRSRVLGGMHWQSDVDDARLIATTSIARMLTSDTFKTQLTAARDETNSILGDSLGLEVPNYDDEQYFAVDNLPNPLIYLPAPPDNDEASPEMSYDMSQYVWGKSVRDTDTGLKARFDINTDLDVLLSEFSRAIDVSISEEYCPVLYSLLQQAVTMSDNACKKAQDYYQRKHPFEYFNEDAYTYEDPSTFTSVGSYPASHACRTWTTALLMVAMNPAMQDTILKVGYDLGQSDVITGINWQSDVDAGRLVSSAVLCRMLSNPNFVDLIQQAQDEYEANTESIVTEEVDIKDGLGSSPSDGRLYTVDGRPATDDTRGVVVGRNTKILRK